MQTITGILDWLSSRSPEPTAVAWWVLLWLAVVLLVGKLISDFSPADAGDLADRLVNREVE